jgi:hypothetical protein
MIDKTIEQIAIETDKNYKDYKKVLGPVIEPNGWNFYSLTTKRKRMFIMQNPGEETKGKAKINKEQRDRVDEWRKDKTSKNLEKAIKSMQEALLNWLSHDNGHFWEFFKILSERSIIDKIDDKSKNDHYNEYIENRFLEDFYVTDLFKYKVSTTKLDNALYGKSEKNEKFRKNLMKILEKEIKDVNPNIIFTFSTRTWETFYTYFKKKNMIEEGFLEKPKESREKTQDTSKDFLRKVSKVHGLTFKLTISGKKIIVIPLCHFSKRFYNILIRDSYFRYFRESLDKNKKVLPILKH